MPEPDCIETAFANEAVRADPPEDAGMKLVGATPVMGVDQNQFHVPFIQCLHLLGSAEADQVLLKAPPRLVADALFLYVHRHPIVLSQPGNQLGCGDERIFRANALHRPTSENAGSLGAERLVIQGRCLEVTHIISIHTLLSFSCHPPVLRRCALFELLSSRAPGGTSIPTGEVPLGCAVPQWVGAEEKIVREREADLNDRAQHLNWSRTPSVEQ